MENKLSEIEIKEKFFNELEESVSEVSYSSCMQFLSKFCEKLGKGNIEYENYIRLTLEMDVEDYVEYYEDDEDGLLHILRNLK